MMNSGMLAARIGVFNSPTRPHDYSGVSRLRVPHIPPLRRGVEITRSVLCHPEAHGAPSTFLSFGVVSEGSAVETYRLRVPLAFEMGDWSRVLDTAHSAITPTQPAKGVVISTVVE